MGKSHHRCCRDCGKISLHKDNIAPEVCCKRCRSQDTNLIRLKPCPFCGEEATLEKSILRDRDYWLVGCRTLDCYGHVFGQTTAYPNEEFSKLQSAWNKRANG